MSTKPKLDDQTQAALSAIEEALKGTAPAPEPRLPEATSDIISVRRPSPEGRSRPIPASASTTSEAPPVSAGHSRSPLRTMHEALAYLGAPLLIRCGSSIRPATIRFEALDAIPSAGKAFRIMALAARLPREIAGQTEGFRSLTRGRDGSHQCTTSVGVQSRSTETLQK